MQNAQSKSRPVKVKKLLSLTKDVVAELERTADELGLTDSAVVELLIRKYAGKLKEELKI